MEESQAPAAEAPQASPEQQVADHRLSAITLGMKVATIQSNPESFPCSRELASRVAKVAAAGGGMRDCVPHLARFMD